MRLHAAAYVDQKQDVDWHVFASEVADWHSLAVELEHKITRFEAGYGFPVAIGDLSVYPCHRDVAFKRWLIVCSDQSTHEKDGWEEPQHWWANLLTSAYAAQFGFVTAKAGLLDRCRTEWRVPCEMYAREASARLHPHSSSTVPNVRNPVDESGGPAVNDPLPATYSELRRIAESRLRRQCPDQTLEGSSLINELIIHLCSGDRHPADSPARVLATVSTALRRILVDYAKALKTTDPAATCRLRLAGATMAQPCRLSQILELDEQLEKLAGQDPRMAKVVELRYFGGMSAEEVAEALETSETTVRRDWRLARAWLYTQLCGNRVHREAGDAG
jgi:RNA polymerase sigma factor (TIGR02999 family)